MIEYAVRDRAEARMSDVEKFPRPWQVEETDTAFIVRDAEGVVVGRVEAGAAMTRHQARAIAEGMVKSAEVLASASEIQREMKM